MNVILLHGFGEDATVWEEFVKKLPGNYAYYAPDFASKSHLKSIADYASWLKEETDAKGWQEMVVIGHSMGGYIALEFAKKNKKALKGLGLFHSTSLADAPERKKKRDKTAAVIEEKGSEAFIQDFYPGMFTEAFKKQNGPFIENQVRLYSRIPKEALVAATLAMKTRKDHTALLKSLKVPVLQIIGGQDLFIPKAQAMEETLLIKTPYSTVVESIAHAGMFESPGICAELTTEFLKDAFGG